MLMRQSRTIFARSGMTENYIRLNLKIWGDWELSLSLSQSKYGGLRGFSISIWIWGNWEVSLSRTEFEATKRFLYLSLNLGDWQVLQSRFESEVTERFLYLDLNLRWWLRGFSTSVWIWGGWEVSLSRFVNLRWLRGFFISVWIWGDWEC